MRKQILVTGASGQLGSDIKYLSEKNLERFAAYQFHFTDSNTLDITNAPSVASYCDTHHITAIINCAAYTAVDKAEEDMELADTINHIAVKNMARIAKEKQIFLIHVSTDYVFNGEQYRPYKEDDFVAPQGVYGETKLKGEQALLDIAPQYAMIVRTSWVYSSFGQNFVKTMLQLGNERDALGVIFDQVGTPTYAYDLAETLLHILQSPKRIDDKVEIYHYSNEGVASWYDFAKAIFELSEITCEVKPILTEEYPTPAKRPHYSLLDKTKIKKAYDVDIPYWRDALKRCLQVMKK